MIQYANNALRWSHIASRDTDGVVNDKKKIIFRNQLCPLDAGKSKRHFQKSTSDKGVKV